MINIVDKEISLVLYAFGKIKYLQTKCFFTGSNPQKLTNENVCFKTGKCFNSVQIMVKKVVQIYFISIYNFSKHNQP